MTEGQKPPENGAEDRPQDRRTWFDGAQIYFLPGRSEAYMLEFERLRAEGLISRVVGRSDREDPFAKSLMDLIAPGHDAFEQALNHALWKTEFRVRGDGRGRFSPGENSPQSVRPARPSNATKRKAVRESRQEAAPAAERKHQARVKQGWEPKGDQNRQSYAYRLRKEPDREIRADLMNKLLSSVAMDLLGKKFTGEGEFLDADGLEIFMTYDPRVREWWYEKDIDGAIRRAAEGACEDFDPELALERSAHGMQMAQISKATRRRELAKSIQNYQEYMTRFPNATEVNAASDLGVTPRTIRNWKQKLRAS